MKLYIPTCTLNFNNIFTTESISPYSFYEKRGFGNKRFYKVEANNLENNIILYSQYPNFTVDNSEMENYPMVIEVETDDYKDKLKKILEKEGVEIYTSNSTIYLNPYNCVIYFQNQKELDYTFITAESSLEIKYREIYKSNLKIIEQIENKFQWNKSFIENINDTELNNESVEQDKFIDKIKGIIFCYLIGESIGSTNQDIVKLQSLEREIKDILESISKKSKKQPTDVQKGRLDKLIKEFDVIIKVNDKLPQAQRNINSLNEIVSAIKYDKLTSREIWSNMEKLIERAETSFDVKNELNALLEILKTKTKKAEKIKEQENRYNAFLNGLSTSIQTFANYNNPFTNIEGIFSIKEGNIISISKPKTDYYESLLNMLIKNEYRKEFDGEQLNKKGGITVSGAEKLREFYNNSKYAKEKSWENSDYSKYVNSLIANIRDSESFDILNTENLVLKSFAAFCQKYAEQYEINELINYMEKEGFIDYKFALGLYGADKGFAILPKTFTNTLINNPSTYDKFLKELHKLLFKSNNLETYNKQERKESQKEENYNDTKLENKIEENLQEHLVNSPTSLLENRDWINYCAENFIIADSKDEKKIKDRFEEDMIWFIGNHNEIYNDKKKGEVKGYYYQADKSNTAVLDRLEKYMNNRKNPKEDTLRWLKKLYENIKITEIIDYLRKQYVI